MNDNGLLHKIALSTHSSNQSDFIWVIQTFLESFLVRIKFFQENPDSYFIKVKELWELWLGP